MKNFLRLYQPRNGYLYNSDSLLLVDFARAFLAPHTLPISHPYYKPHKSKPLNIIDIGAGCGIVGLLCAKHFGVRSHLIEIDKSMATLAYINATTNGECIYEAKSKPPQTKPTQTQLAKNQQNAKITASPHIHPDLQNQTFLSKSADKIPLARVYNIDFLDSSLPKILPQMLSQHPQSPHTKNQTAKTKIAQSTKPQNPSNPKADFCISNPPFYPDGALRSSNPALLQARYATSMPLELWIPQAKRVLAPRGGLIFCYHPSELARVFTTLKQSGFTPEVLRLVYPLREREASLALIYARLNSRSTLKIAPPLFTHNTHTQVQNLAQNLVPKDIEPASHLQNSHTQNPCPQSPTTNGNKKRNKKKCKPSAIQDDFTPEVANIYATYRTHSIKVALEDIDCYNFHQISLE